jgi:hypothetical protein
VDDCTCPSAPGRPGALLIGVIGRRGSVGYVNPSPTVDDTFLRLAGESDLPLEKRFRFASPCVEGGCAQWTGSRCGVIDEVLGVDEVIPTPASESLPRCAIRTMCRWFAQSGADACRVCPQVITDCK